MAARLNARHSTTQAGESLPLRAVTPARAVAATGRDSEQVRAWLDEVAHGSDKIAPMPGETITREMIYQDHG